MLHAEISLKEYIEKNEKRTATLESEIGELYRVIANYENKKYFHNILKNFLFFFS